MSLFKKKKSIKPEHDTAPAVKVNAFDIAKEARKSKQANEHFATVLDRNHITIRIYSQLGGKTKRTKA